MSEGLNLAITAQFRFEADDFKYMAEHFKFGYWARLDNSGTSRGEHFYSLAVEVANTSAAIAFEKFKERSPFIYFGRRLAIGSEFVFPSTEQGQIWKVNSFAQDGKTINCGHYVLKEGAEYGEKILVARKSLTKKDLKAEKRAIEQAEAELRRRLEEEAQIAHALKTGQPRSFDMVLGGDLPQPQPFDVVLGNSQ